MDQAQKILDRKRCQIREHKIQKLREYSNPRFEYHKKVNFIEGNIEKDMIYLEESNNKFQIHNFKKKMNF